MRIALVSSQLASDEHSGIVHAMRDLAQELLLEGHAIQLITDGVAVPGVSEDIPVHNVPPASPLERAATVHATLARLHTAGELDVASVPLWGCEGLVAVRDRRFPTVVTCMTSAATLVEISPSRAGSGLSEMVRLERAYIESARHLHGLTRAVLDKTTSAYGAQPLTSAVVPRGIADRAQAGRSADRAHGSPRVQILFVGRLERRKGVDVLLEAVTILIEEGRDVALTLAGIDSPDTERTETYREAFAATASAAVAERVRFTGPVSQSHLDQLFAEVDVVCQPSRYESHGIVLVEAMMFGKPIVTTHGGGIPEVVEPDGNALLAKPGDVPSLVDALRATVMSASLRHRLAARSRARYLARFEIGVVAPAMIDLFSEAIRAHDADRADARSPSAHSRRIRGAG